ncbi:MAG TPA: DUF357 domain-containing protein [Candidatus Bathyarchaeia archaeon]|jgi:FAD synthetase|nr:DUF357 domain-containing protein [Candidatus Bathyarchaeia archaeon]
MNERAGERAKTYLHATSRSLRVLKKTGETIVSQAVLDNVLELSRSYERDARHYLLDRKPVTALACVAYAEGLLDALRSLKLVEF